MFECQCNSKSGITELVLIRSRIISRGGGGPKGPVLFKGGIRLVKRSSVLQVSYLFSKNSQPAFWCKLKKTCSSINISGYGGYAMSDLVSGTKEPVLVMGWILFGMFLWEWLDVVILEVWWYKYYFETN